MYKSIIIPKTKVKELTRMVDYWNMIYPVEIKDGRFVLPIDVLEILSLKQRVTQDLKQLDIYLKSKPVEDLTKEDFINTEINSKKL